MSARWIGLHGTLPMDTALAIARFDHRVVEDGIDQLDARDRLPEGAVGMQPCLGAAPSWPRPLDEIDPGWPLPARLSRRSSTAVGIAEFSVHTLRRLARAGPLAAGPSDVGVAAPQVPVFVLIEAPSVELVGVEPLGFRSVDMGKLGPDRPDDPGVTVLMLVAALSGFGHASELTDPGAAEREAVLIGAVHCGGKRRPKARRAVPEIVERDQPRLADALDAERARDFGCAAQPKPSAGVYGPEGAGAVLNQAAGLAVAHTPALAKQPLRISHTEASLASIGRSENRPAGGQPLSVGPQSGLSDLWVDLNIALKDGGDGAHGNMTTRRAMS